MLNEKFNEVLMNNDEDNIPLLTSNVMTVKTGEVAKQLNQVLINDGDKTPLSRLKVLSNTEKKEQKQKKRKKDYEIMPMKKKRIIEEWKSADCAHAVGRVIKFTFGEREIKKRHYEEFAFRDKKYGLGSTVLLNPEVVNQKPYIAIIKDIYKRGKEGDVMLMVQWFYRPDDIEKKYIGNWEFTDSRSLFYSFHSDEVNAESVKQMCIVNFVPESKQMPNRIECPGFIVQNVYDTTKKKVLKFDGNDFNEMERNEIDMLVEKTSMRVGRLPDIEKEKRTLKSRRRKQPFPKRSIINDEEMWHSSSNVVSAPHYRSTSEKFDLPTEALDREKILEELMQAVKLKCRVTKKKKKKKAKHSDFWPSDAVHVVRALEQDIYNSLANDIPKYNQKCEILVDQLQNSRMLAERLLNGELNPEQIIRMTPFELTRGRTFDEMKADIEDQYRRQTIHRSTPESSRILLDHYRRYLTLSISSSSFVCGVDLYLLLCLSKISRGIVF